MVSARAISLASGVVLARVLSPRDFGVFAIALVATEMLMSLNDVGLIAALVRWPGDVLRLARTAVTLVLIASGMLYGVIFFAAAPFAAAVHAPDATGVVRLLTLAILIDAISAVPSGLLTRAMRQDLRAIGDVLGLVVSVSVSVALALLGLGPWSLAWGRLAGNATAAAFFIWKSPLPRPGFHRGDARDLLDFGLPMAGASLVTFGLLNLHYLVVGSILGPAALGFYVLAFNLSNWPVGLLAQAARRVSLIGFARLAENPESLRRGFVKAFLLLMGVTVPSCLLLSLLGEPLTRVMYGSKWTPSAEALRFLAAMAAVRVATSLIEDLLAALGRSRSVLRLQLTWLVSLLPALAVGAQLNGIRGVGIAQAAVALVMLPLFFVAVQRAGVTINDLVSRLPALGYAAAGAAAATLLLLHVVAGDLRRLLLIAPSALAVYALTFLSVPGLRSVVWQGRLTK